MSESAASTKTLRAEDFVKSIGVNTHLSYWDTAWGVGNGQWAGAQTKVLAELTYLGINTVRDGMPLNFDEAEYASLASAGIHFDVIQSVTNGQIDVISDVASIAAFNKLHPGAIVSYEGANEYNINNYTLAGQNSLNNLSWSLTDAREMSSALKANVDLSNVKILAASAVTYETLPNLGAYVDESNGHVYAGPGEQLQRNIASGVTAVAATAPGAPVVLTEVGTSSSSLSSATSAVAGSAATQGLIDTNALLDAYNDGVQQTFLYELMDDNLSSQKEDNFGLFNTGGTPKAAAVDVHNLISILSDNGQTAETFATGKLNYSVQNLPTTASSMLLEKSSGAFDLVLWNGDAPLVNSTSTVEITPPTTNVTVQFSALYKQVNIFDPILSSMPIKTLNNVSSMTISLAADPVIIEVEPSPVTVTLQPLIKILTGNRDGGATLAGTSTANSTVTVTETTGSQITVLGTATTSSNGSWQFTSHAMINRSTVHSFSISAQDPLGRTGIMPGSLFLDSNGVDTMKSNAGVSDVFAVMSPKGSEVIAGFETALSAGSTHDYIDFSGRGITSFTQVQSMLSGTTTSTIAMGSGRTITLSNVAVNSLTAADFRFS